MFNPTHDLDERINDQMQHILRKARKMHRELDALIEACEQKQPGRIKDLGLTGGYLARDAAHLGALVAEIEGLAQAREMYTHPDAHIVKRAPEE